MERNREARRASMVAAPNGLSRRRHRPNSLRDSPDEDGQVEFSESARLRERVKKDRDRERNRERDREREIERSSRSKRRRGDRLIHGGDSSQESNDDEDYEDEDGNHQHPSNGGGGAARSVPPNPPAAAASFQNHHHQSSSGNHHYPHHQQNHLHHHKTFQPSSTNVLRTSPVWKSGDEVIGISVPRKARSAHTKRSHDWISCTATAANGGGVGRDQNHRQTSTSPVRQSLPMSPAPPLSPTSSNVSGRKKIKANGSKQRPPKTSSKSTSSNREELEIEIAEVLYGLMTQSQAPSKKEIVAPNDSAEINNRSSGDAVSSAVSNSQSPAILPMNTNSCAAPFSAIAPKRKKPRQVSENQSSPSIRSSPSSASAKLQNDQTMTLKAEASSPNSEKMPFENGGSVYALTSPLISQGKAMSVDRVLESVVDSEAKPAAGCEPSPREDHEAARKEDAHLVKMDSASVAVEVSNCEDSAVATTATTCKPSAVSDVETHREKIQIDLMAPPPPLRSSPEGECKVDFFSTVEHKRNLSDSITETRLDDGKVGKVDQPTVEAEEMKARAVVETEPKKRNDGRGQGSDLQLNLETPERDSVFADNKSQQLGAKTSKEQQSMVMEKPVLGQSSTLALPMSIPSWSCGLPPLGYMPPLQGVLTMDGSTIPSTPLQPVFSQPRPKRCASHCYIARNIHLLQQFMKMNPFWPPAANPAASLFGSNLNVVPAAEFNGNIVGRGGSTGLDKGHGLAIFPGLGSKDKCSQASNIPDPVQRNQQILLQQPLPPPVAPNSLLPGHTYIIPLNQQQAAPLPGGGAAKSTAAIARSHVPSSATNSAVGGVGSATAAGGNHATTSFSYPNVPPNETPYLAILQNNAYFQIPAVGAPLNYRGGHPQPLPLFNGSFYSPQMIHPAQLQQQHPPTNSQQSKQMQQGQPNASLSSGSSSSHKHLQNQQKRPQGHGAPINGNNGNGSPLPFPASKSHTIQPQHLQNQIIHPPQSRHIENELCGEDSPSTAESRARPPANVYNQNYLMQIHPSNFGVMASSATMGVVPAPTSSSGNNSEKQRALKTGLESMLHQHFAMPFASSISSGASAPGNNISSVAHNQAIFQTLPDATRQNFPMVTGAAAPQKKSYGDGSRGGSGDPTASDERKVSSSGKAPPASARQSMALSGSDLTDVSASSKMTATTNVSLASGGPAWTAHAVMPTSAGPPLSKAKMNAQYQKQLFHQLQQQQFEQAQQIVQQKKLAANAAQSKAPHTSNGTVPSEYLTSSAAPPAGGSMFSNSISAFPQNLVQISSNNSSPSRSPQWKSSAARASTSQALSSSSSLVAPSSSVKNHTQQQQQQQQLRAQQNHTQISFGANHKSTSQGQHLPNSGQSQSSTMMAGSPTTSSISKGAAASGSPRTATSASMSNKTDQTPSQQGKSSIQMPNQKSSPAGGRSVPSILGNQHAIPSTSGCGSNKTQMQQQQHLPKGAHQSQLFFSGSYAQTQSTNPSSASATSGYFVQRRHPEQQQAQHPPGSTMPTSSSSMLTMCPVSLGSGGSTPNHSKATAASANMRGTSLPPQNIPQFSSHSSGNQHHILPAGFSYVQPAQVKPTEQKQPAGNDNLNACWQPEKR
ncbi:unnamed protein product [Cuscuta campestris]|uniref:Protein TIME FOR COFFEE n=1 Tax=Cuscuta campestris TaxID=132261 RepID=A0A484KP03_9ASTE|nr:unnamed protein product [Cuscuta campestris]